MWYAIDVRGKKDFQCVCNLTLQEAEFLKIISTIPLTCTHRTISQKCFLCNEPCVNNVQPTNSRKQKNEPIIRSILELSYLFDDSNIYRITVGFNKTHKMDIVCHLLEMDYRLLMKNKHRELTCDSCSIDDESCALEHGAYIQTITRIDEHASKVLMENQLDSLNAFIVHHIIDGLYLKDGATKLLVRH